MEQVRSSNPICLVRHPVLRYREYPGTPVNRWNSQLRAKLTMLHKFLSHDRRISGVCTEGMALVSPWAQPVFTGVGIFLR
jgi:hypothetical protein